VRIYRDANFFVGIFLFLGFFSSNAVSEEQFPEKPITLIVPYAAGGSSDLNARVFASFLDDYLGQPVLIKLVPGQAGQKGTLEAVRSKPDGHTLLFTDNYRDQLHRYTFRNSAYDTNTDLVTVARVNYGAIGIIVRGDSIYETWVQLEAAAKLRPGGVTMSHSGLWVAFFVPAIQVMKDLDLQLRMVPYRGGGPAKAALLAGDVDMSMAFPSTIAADAEAGRVRILATAGSERLIPNVPSFVEIGLPPTTGFMHRVVMAPTGISEKRLMTLRKAFSRMQQEQGYQRMMNRLGENTEYLDGTAYEAVRVQQSSDYRELAGSLFSQ
jgi:tripartite-type tricarboxylate transporter receptor subunit TctC